MKKKILAIVLCICMLAIAIVGGTLAYFTDTDEVTNVMAVGSVKIEQIEKERGADGTLQDFTQNKPVVPAVGPIAWADEPITVGGDVQEVFTAELKNVVDKFVYVQNTGKSNAYVRTIVMIEAPGGDPNNLIHINANDKGSDLTGTPLMGIVTVEGVDYFYMVFTYSEALAPNALTPVSLAQVFLDSKTTNEDVAAYGATWEIHALSQAVQADGFEAEGTKAAAEVALDTAFGEVNETNLIDWFTT